MTAVNFLSILQFVHRKIEAVRLNRLLALILLSLLSSAAGLDDFGGLLVPLSSCGCARLLTANSSIVIKKQFATMFRIVLTFLITLNRVKPLSSLVPPAEFLAGICLAAGLRAVPPLETAWRTGSIALLARWGGEGRETALTLPPALIQDHQQR